MHETYQDAGTDVGKRKIGRAKPDAKAPIAAVAGQPTIAFAFPGCAGGAIACVGMLDELNAQGVPVSMIASCSSTSIMATAYAAGRLDELRDFYLGLRGRDFWHLLKFSMKSGIFTLGRLAEVLHQITPVENIEDLDIPVAIMASDLVSGEAVTLTMGNISRAVNASCSYPGLFEPVIWGGKVLVDGGLFSIIPDRAARSFNADLVIAVEMHNQHYIFVPPMIWIRKLVLALKRLFGFNPKQLKMNSKSADGDAQPSFLQILGVSMDYAIQRRTLKRSSTVDCDLLIDFDTRGTKGLEFNRPADLYNKGRATIRHAMPEIRKLMAEGPRSKITHEVLHESKYGQQPAYAEEVDNA